MPITVQYTVWSQNCNYEFTDFHVWGKWNDKENQEFECPGAEFVAALTLLMGY
jgi:hypothetical protein